MGEGGGGFNVFLIMYIMILIYMARYVLIIDVCYKIANHDSCMLNVH